MNNKGYGTTPTKTTRTRRTNEQRRTDRNILRKVLEDAPGWVGLGYIITRVDTGTNQTKQDLRDVVAQGMYQIVKTPGQGRGKSAKWAHMNNVRDELAADILTSEVKTVPDTNKPRRTASKLIHPNRMMAWLPAETQQLVDEVRNGMTLTEMAHEHGRTEKAIESRLYRLAREGRIKWGTRTGTPLRPAQVAAPTTDFDKATPNASESDATPSLGSIFAPKPPMSFGAQAARHEALHTCVGAFLKGKVTLNGLQNAYDAVTESKGDA